MIFLRSTNGLNCSGNLTYGNSSTTISIAATFSQFVSIVGSFYDDTWYNYPVNSTIGPNNQINSTRIITDSTGPGAAVQTDNFGSFILGSYIETLTGQTICGGSAVLINFGIVFCASNVTAATIVLAQGHVSDCSICELDDYFNQSNGYGCTPINVNTTMCTCPDQRSTTNQPCRICNRIEICGPSTEICSEQSTTFDPSPNKPHYACFCSSGLFQIGKSCLEGTTTITPPITETTKVIDPITTTVVNITAATSIETTTRAITSTSKDATTTPMVTKCDDRSISSHLYIEPILIILLNLVYFVNK